MYKILTNGWMRCSLKGPKHEIFDSLFFYTHKTYLGKWRRNWSKKIFCLNVQFCTVSVLFYKLTNCKHTGCGLGIASQQKPSSKFIFYHCFFTRFLGDGLLSFISGCFDNFLKELNVSLLICVFKKFPCMHTCCPTEGSVSRHGAPRYDRKEKSRKVAIIEMWRLKRLVQGHLHPHKHRHRHR